MRHGASHVRDIQVVTRLGWHAWANDGMWYRLFCCWIFQGKCRRRLSTQNSGYVKCCYPVYAIHSGYPCAPCARSFHRWFEQLDLCIQRANTAVQFFNDWNKWGTTSCKIQVAIFQGLLQDVVSVSRHATNDKMASSIPIPFCQKTDQFRDDRDGWVSLIWTTA